MLYGSQEQQPETEAARAADPAPEAMAEKIPVLYLKNAAETRRDVGSVLSLLAKKVAAARIDAQSLLHGKTVVPRLA